MVIHKQREELVTVLGRPALSLALAFSLSVAALAQAPFAGGNSRSLSNLTGATQTFDTFLGNDNTGPYVLGWKDIQTRGAEIYIDGRQLLPAQYFLDPIKGEITFTDPIKRSQMVRVVYSYYPGQAQRNTNPAASAPLTANLGKIQILALSSPVDGMRRTVWGVNDKTTLLGGGFSGQFFMASESMDGQTREAGTFGKAGVKLGYNAGDAKNGIDANFLRGGRDFGGYGAQVGIAEATQNLNLAARLNPNKYTGVNFSQVDNRNLNNKPGVFQQSLTARVGGLGFSQTVDDKPDAKGIRTRVETEKTSLDTALGGLKIAASDGNTQTLGVDGKTTGTDSQVVDLKLAPKNKPSLGFNRTENGTIDAAGNRTQVTTEKTDLGSAVGRAAVVANLTNIDTLTPDKQRSSDDTKSLGVSLAEKNRPALSYLRSENEKVDAAGAKITTTSDRAEVVGKFGKANVTAKTFQSNSLFSDGNRSGAEQSTYGVGLGPTSLLRTEDLKTDVTGGVSGVITDKFDTRKRLGRADITVASLLVATTTPDLKKNIVETQKVDVKLPNGVNLTRLVDEKTDPTGAKTEVETQKADLTGKLGKGAITASTAQVNTTTPDPNTTGTSKETTVALTGNGAVKGTGATIALTGGGSQTGAGTEQKQGVSVKVQPTPTLAIGAEQKDQVVTPDAGTPKLITTQGASAELRPMAGTLFTGAWRMSMDGTSEASVTEYGAQFGKDKTALQFNGGMVNRASMAGGLAALDSARANVKLRPAPGLLLTTNYILNPEDKGVITPMTRREFGLQAKTGSLEVGGAYSATEYSQLTPQQLRDQAGAMEYGEYSLSVGLRFGQTGKLTTELKDSFFAGVPKGTRSIGLGVSHTAGTAFLSLTGTMVTNRAVIGADRNNVRAEAKLGIKF
ncbi:MAG: hypothetical protein QM758_00255 [Armatimonas sp.]